MALVLPVGIGPTSAVNKTAALTSRRREPRTTSITSVNAPALALIPSEVVQTVGIGVTDAVRATALDESGLSENDGQVSHRVVRGVVEDTALALALVWRMNEVLTSVDRIGPRDNRTLFNRLLSPLGHEFKDVSPFCVCKHGTILS